jgi:hypothetical protein
MKNLILFISIAALFTNCKKEKIARTISGQFFTCGPAAEFTNYDLVQQKNGSDIDVQILATTKPDITGKFSFDYVTDNSTDRLFIRQSSGFGYNKIIEGIENKDISDLNIYLTFKYHLIVNLNVTKQYTHNDTLYMANYNNGTPIGLVKVAGPFVSGRKFTFPNLNLGTSISAPGYSGTLHRYYCLLNTPYGASGAFDKDYIVPLSTKCSGDSTYLSLDIK